MISYVVKDISCFNRW